VWNALGVPAAPDPGGAARLRDALDSRSYIAVRDPHSAARLADAGVSAEITVVPDPAIALENLFPSARLAERLSDARAAGWYPAGNAIVVQGSDLLHPHVAGLADALRPFLVTHPDLQPVLIETGLCRGDGAIATALASALGTHVWRPPANLTIADLAAAIAGARAFVGSSLHGAITALAYDRPFLLLNFAPEPKLAGFAAVTGLGDRVVGELAGMRAALPGLLSQPSAACAVASLRQTIATHFDTIASIAERSADERPMRLASASGLAHNAARHELDVVRASARGRADAHERLALLEATKTLRYTALPRRYYERARSRLSRGRAR
jgi:hypothetical protein